MDINDIKAELEKENLQARIQAISALKNHPASLAVPLLIEQLKDPEFLVRAFVTRQLGLYQTPESFEILLETMKSDQTPSVRAEASNSLSLFGESAVSHLVETFGKDKYWIVRHSILAAFAEMDVPEAMYEISLIGLAGDDLTVQESSVEALGTLAHSSQAEIALAKLLELHRSEVEPLRIKVAYTLKHFDSPRAKEALAVLRQDESHRVVRAAMEDLII